jgi:hypothetical protein
MSGAARSFSKLIAERSVALQNAMARDCNLIPKEFAKVQEKVGAEYKLWVNVRSFLGFLYI